MSDRDGFAPGVPCLVAGVFPDPDAAAAFYSDLFGWETEDLMPAEQAGSYILCRLHGRVAAAVVSEHGAPAPPEPGWTTLIWVENADESAAQAVELGGRVIAQPFDSPGGGRQAVLADPAGAVFSVWEPRERRGAQVVNEPGAWSMSLLSTSDQEGAERFYSELFGWETRAFDMGGAEITMFAVPGYVGGLPQQPVPRDIVAVMMPLAGAGEEPARWSVDFWTADVGAAVTKLSQAGGEVLMPPSDLPGGFRQAVVRDPQGATLTLTRPSGGS